MARVTVEDCVLKVPNRFELVMMASQRSRDIASGADISIERDNDKNPVVALREIADETVPLNDLGDSVVRGLQKHVEVDEPEEEDEDSDYIDENFEMDETDEFWGINRHRCGDFIQNTNDIKNMDQKNIPLRHRESKKQLYQYVNK